MRRFVFFAVTMFLQLSVGHALAASCSKDDFAKAVDRAGASLRKLNTESTPRLQAKMRQLKDAKGWPDAGFEEKSYAALQDERVAAFDAQANDLLAKVDTLGTVDPSADPDCAKLEELTATSLELQATIKAKTAYILAKLDQMIAPPTVAVEAPKSKPPEARKAPPQPSTQLQPSPQPQTPPSASAKKAPEITAWSTQSKGEPKRDVAIAPPPSQLPVQPPASTSLNPPPQPDPEEEGYTIDEIRAASAGFFGKVSANLGAVIEYVFSNSGRPTGYILGNEGGGAFLAGVRYGKGTLYMRAGGTQRIYWHGPSLGTDVGADGSKTLFLIYRLGSAEQLFAAFTGIDGSAFVVGGIGATLVTNGNVVLAPIRSGVGLRIGANVGYIRFTPHSTWNPF